jgi:hypothetical protein
MKCTNNTWTVTRLLVGPPAGRGYFSNAHHELSKMNSPLKRRNTVLYNFGNGKWKNKRESRFFSNTLLLLLLKLLSDHPSGIYKFTDQVVDHRRVEPLLNSEIYIK